VVFTAGEEKFGEIRAMFLDIQQKQSVSDQYHLPSFVTGKGYMIDIEIQNNRISFETRWVPNLETLMEIADFYDATFACRFHEMSNGLFGEARYNQKTLTVANLNMEDFKALRYDKQKKGYPFGEQVFEYEGDLLDYILDQKMEKQLGITTYTVQRE
jgi:hypothetical protein